MLVPEVSRSQALQQLEQQIRELLESFGGTADYHFHVQHIARDTMRFAEMKVHVRVPVEATQNTPLADLTASGD